ncbi:hypothetical protein ACFYM2_12055 [Streptomyces sp. NPDC006711]|uniref:hypothetical protein n=1 Tax=Streptomyces sp. NPDC006711 TaxID=3364762 RepID=UPI003675EA80
MDRLTETAEYAPDEQRARFGGVIDVRPTPVAELDCQANRGFLARHPALRMPCDAKGVRRPA